MPKYIFPKEFIWGTVASAYQIEGAYQADGKGESIWDHFTHIPGNILNGDTGDIACDHYHRYKEDVKLLKQLGVKSYRFSIAWTRIFPDGMGKPNKKGMEFYRNLSQLLIEHGIMPSVTLYHWDLPQKLQDNGGWLNRDTAYAFTEYARYVFSELGDIIPLWVTCNEPWAASFVGYWYGGHPPGITNFSAALHASHHILLAHGMAVRAFREMDLKGEIGITLNLHPAYPASESKEDLAAAKRYGDFVNSWFLDPIFKGHYPVELLDWLSDKVTLPQYPAEDMEIINTPIDFLGVNSYSSSSVAHDSEDWPLKFTFAKTGMPTTDTGWDIYPEGLYDLLLYLHNQYAGVKMLITENGAAFNDVIDEAGKVNDVKRINYLREHITEAHKALAAGVNLAGYYVWSFLDNYEWIMGYSKRFGLVYVDYPTQQRIIKQSGQWYKDVVENNGIV